MYIAIHAYNTIVYNIHCTSLSPSLSLISYIHIPTLPCTQFIFNRIILLYTATEPKITDFYPEIHANTGEQVTLRVNFTGIPKPTITWTFKGTKMEGDYATELGTDGSLLFVCVEKKHAGR